MFFPGPIHSCVNSKKVLLVPQKRPIIHQQLLLPNKRASPQLPFPLLSPCPSIAGASLPAPRTQGFPKGTPLPLDLSPQKLGHWVRPGPPCHWLPLLDTSQASEVTKFRKEVEIYVYLLNIIGFFLYLYLMAYTVIILFIIHQQWPFNASTSFLPLKGPSWRCTPISQPHPARLNGHKIIHPELPVARK